MRKLTLLLFLSALALASVHVNAMMEREEDPKKEESKEQEALKYSKQQEEKDIINNIGASYGGTTKALWKSEDKSDIPLEESMSPEKEDLLDLGILKQRIEEAQEVTDFVARKGTAISEQELGELYQKWNKRYERYKEQADLLGQSNNIETIAGQQIEERLKELVEASRVTVEALLPCALTLEHFRCAVANHPLATRFVLKKENDHSSVQRQEALEALNPTFKNENRKIFKKLRVLISTNYSTPIAESISSLTLFSIKKGAALSAEKFRNIIRSADLLQLLQSSPDFEKFKGYIEFALESLVTNTASNRNMIVQRALAKAREAGASETALKKLPQFLNQSSDFKDWLKEKGPCLRSIPPSLVEEEMRHPGTTAIEVVKNHLGVVITVYKKDDVFDRENESVQKGSEGSRYLFDYSHPFELEEGTDSEKYLVPRGRTIYHDISYTEHALERMALDTPSNRKRITDHFIEKVKSPKQEERKLSEDELKVLPIFFEQPVAFQEWWKKNDPRLQEDCSFFSMKGEKKEIIHPFSSLDIKEVSREVVLYELANDVSYLIEKSAYLLRGIKKFVFGKKVPHLKENGFSLIADLWRRSALQRQVAVENLREALEARTSGTEEEFANAYQLTKKASWNASCLEETAASFERSEEAKQNNNQSLTLLCEKCAEEYQQLLAGYERKIAAASLLPSSSRVDYYNAINNWTKRRTNSLHQITTTLQKALKATLEGDHTRSSRLETIAGQWQMALKYEKIAAVKADNLKEKKINKYFERVSVLAKESADLLNDALTLEEASKACTRQQSKKKQKAEQKLLESQHKQLLGEDYQKAAEAWDLRKSKEESIFWEQAAAAEQRDNFSLAAIWRQAAEQRRAATEFRRQSAKARAAGNEEENSRFKQLFIAAIENTAQLKKEATILEALEKADEAERDHNPSIANLWRQFIEQMKIADDYGEQAKRAGVEGNKNMALDKAANSARGVAFWLSNAASFFEKAQATKNENYLTCKFWEKIAEENKKRANDQHRVTAGYLLGEKEKLKHWDEIDDLLIESAHQRNGAIAAFKEYSEAVEEKNPLTVDLWHQSSDQHYHAATHYGKVIDVSFKEAPDLARLWKATAEQHNTAALCYEEAAETPQRLEREALHQAANRFMLSAGQLKNAATSFEKALQVEANGNQAHAILLQKSFEQYQLAARCLGRSAQAIILKYTCLKHPLEAAFWENKKVCYQSAITLYQQSAEAYAQGNKIAGDDLNQEASAAEEAAKALQNPKKGIRKKEKKKHHDDKN